MYVSVFDREKYVFFSRISWSDIPSANVRWWQKAERKFGDRDLFRKLSVLETHFVGACVCYDRLRGRSEEMRRIAADASVGTLMSDPILKEMHAYEYFFFMCCGYIYNDLILVLRHTRMHVDRELMSRLRQLKEERRVKEHGHDWEWGQVPPQGTSPSKGDNYDFERNMHLLDRIYDGLVSQSEV